jgi:hypothetical protein
MDFHLGNRADFLDNGTQQTAEILNLRFPQKQFMHLRCRLFFTNNIRQICIHNKQSLVAFDPVHIDFTLWYASSLYHRLPTKGKLTVKHYAFQSPVHT